MTDHSCFGCRMIFFARSTMLTAPPGSPYGRRLPAPPGYPANLQTPPNRTDRPLCGPTRGPSRTPRTGCSESVGTDRMSDVETDREDIVGDREGSLLLSREPVGRAGAQPLRDLVLYGRAQPVHRRIPDSFFRYFAD